MVRVPDAAGQVRSAPVKALRGFFAGIGQLLVTADRFKADEARRERAQYEQDREHEEAQRAPEAQGGLPEAQGAPETQGGLPEAQGAPETQGGLPEAQGAPEAQGGLPEAQGGLPEAQGGLPEAQGGLPEAQGGLPEAQRAPETRDALWPERRSRQERDGGGGHYEPLTAPRAAPTAGRSRDSRDSRDSRSGRDARAGRHRATGLQGPAASAQAPTRRFRSLDSTGNVRLLTADEAVGDSDGDAPAPHEQLPSPPGPPPAAAPVPAPRAAAAAGVSAGGLRTAAAPNTPDAAPSTPAAASNTPAAGPGSPADLPVPGYDQLTLASLRSRLRYLDAAQLRVLSDYEKARANRADVVRMFERRIAKLQAAATHAT